jgi:hypothetical protein
MGAVQAAAQVAAPIKPSTLRPFSFWNAFATWAA